MVNGGAGPRARSPLRCMLLLCRCFVIPRLKKRHASECVQLRGAPHAVFTCPVIPVTNAIFPLSPFTSGSPAVSLAHELLSTFTLLAAGEEPSAILSNQVARPTPCAPTQRYRNRYAMHADSATQEFVFLGAKFFLYLYTTVSEK